MRKPLRIRRTAARHYAHFSVKATLVLDWIGEKIDFHEYNVTVHKINDKMLNTHLEKERQ